MRIKKGGTSLRIELNDADKYKDWSESPYEVISCISDDGINIIISSDIDPNPTDITLPYALIIEPVTGSITELRDMLRCWILTKSRSAGNEISENGDPYIMIFPDVNQLGTPGCYTVIPNASCPYVLQNSGGTLYFDGLPLGGGGGGITTADNGLTINPAGNVQLGGILIHDTFISGSNLFQLAISGLSRFLAIGSEVELTTLTADSSFHMQDGNDVTLDSAVGIINTTDTFLTRSLTVPSEIFMGQNLTSTTMDHNNNITHKVTSNIDPAINAFIAVDIAAPASAMFANDTNGGGSISVSPLVIGSTVQDLFGNITTIIHTQNDFTTTATAAGGVSVSTIVNNPTTITTSISDPGLQMSSNAINSYGIDDVVIDFLNSRQTQVIQRSDALTIDAGLNLRYRNYSANTLLTPSDYVVFVESLSLALTITLPSNPINGTVFVIKDWDGGALTNNITIDANGLTIDGAATKLINTAYGKLTIMFCNGLQWSVIA